MSTVEPVPAHFTDPETNKKLTRRVLWKLDTRILPALALLWLANFIDRSNIGNARIAGLERDTHLHGNQFNAALAVFYSSYILVELPSNWILKKMRANRWLPILVATWGAVTTLSGLVHNFSGLIAIRIFLGLCEGGLLPGIVLYLSSLYKPHELQQRVGIFYASASLSGAFGGLLATAIIKMDGVGKLAGWRWIFILEGIATVFIALIAWLMMPADLSTAKFFTDEERQFALWRFRSAQTVTTGAPLSEPSQKITADVDAEKDKGSEVQIEAHPAQFYTVYQEDEKFEWTWPVVTMRRHGAQSHTQVQAAVDRGSAQAPTSRLRIRPVVDPVAASSYYSTPFAPRARKPMRGWKALFACAVVADIHTRTPSRRRSVDRLAWRETRAVPDSIRGRSRHRDSSGPGSYDGSLSSVLHVQVSIPLFTRTMYSRGSIPPYDSP